MLRAESPVPGLHEQECMVFLQIIGVLVVVALVAYLVVNRKKSSAH